MPWFTGVGKDDVLEAQQLMPDRGSTLSARLRQIAHDPFGLAI
jgi:hypothetical protein